jgi:hypothetical protein
VTYTSSTSVQFSCIALDAANEVVCAGGFDTFNIFVSSIKTGKLPYVNFLFLYKQKKDFFLI